MVKWRFKGCPRCQGDVQVYDDVERCLQCGHEHDLHDSDFRPALKSAPRSGKTAVR